jgi:hypothetical protein
MAPRRESCSSVSSFSHPLSKSLSLCPMTCILTKIHISLHYQFFDTSLTTCYVTEIRPTLCRPYRRVPPHCDSRRRQLGRAHDNRTHEQGGRIIVPSPPPLPLPPTHFITQFTSASPSIPIKLLSFSCSTSSVYPSAETVCYPPSLARTLFFYYFMRAGQGFVCWVE